MGEPNRCVLAPRRVEHNFAEESDVEFLSYPIRRRYPSVLMRERRLNGHPEWSERSAADGGCFFWEKTIKETAEALGVSGSTVSRDWDLAQAWLYREMQRIHGGGSCRALTRLSKIATSAIPRHGSGSMDSG
jgi:hypothetical protein